MRGSSVFGSFLFAGPFYLRWNEYDPHEGGSKRWWIRVRGLEVSWAMSEAQEKRQRAAIDAEEARNMADFLAGRGEYEARGSYSATSDREAVASEDVPSISEVVAPGSQDETA